MCYLGLFHARHLGHAGPVYAQPFYKMVGTNSPGVPPPGGGTRIVGVGVGVPGLCIQGHEFFDLAQPVPKVGELDRLGKLIV
jgi:hypothetical protein